MHVAYVLLRFPSLTETFIAEEILNVIKCDIQVHLYSLLPPKMEVLHPSAVQLLPQVHYVPEIYQPVLWMVQVYYLFKYPSKYLMLFGKVIRQSALDPKFLLQCLIIFLKSVWLARELERSEVQLVHAHFAWLPGLSGMIVSQFLSLPFTITTHAYDIYVKKNNLLELAARPADLIVTISHNNEQEMRGMSAGLSKKNIEVVHCGVDLEYFHPELQKDANETFQITSVGTLIEKKGHEYLIRACQELISRGVKFQCVILGTGPLEGFLQKLIRDLKLEDFVSLSGPQTQTCVRERLGKSDLFVLACVVDDQGDRDGIPVAIMEAMALNIPVVSTPVSGIGELVQHEKTGLLVPERDSRALSVAILRLIQDESLRLKLAGQARLLVEKEYDVSKNASRLSALFQEVINKN